MDVFGFLEKWNIYCLSVWIANIRDPCIADYAHNLNILPSRIVADADPSPNRIFGMEQALRQPSTDDCRARLLTCVFPINVSSFKKADAEGLKEAWRYHGQASLNLVIPCFR